MARLTPAAHGLAVLGGVLVVVGWAIGGFPSPEGAGAALFVVGIAVGLLAELGVWLANRRT